MEELTACTILHRKIFWQEKTGTNGGGIVGRYGKAGGARVEWVVGREVRGRVVGRACGMGAGRDGRSGGTLDKIVITDGDSWVVPDTPHGSPRINTKQKDMRREGERGKGSEDRN